MTAHPQSSRGNTLLYFDDLVVAQRFVSGTHLLDEHQIKAFAKQFASADRSLRADMLFPLSPDIPVPATATAPNAPVAYGTQHAPPALESLEASQRNHILAALERTHWVVDGPHGAAKILAMHPNTLRSRMKKLGIARASRQG
jgi:transcriptional regulator with GAF, ATPase, and Fis domain